MLGTNEDLLDGELRRRPLRAPSILPDDIELFADLMLCDDVDLSVTCTGPAMASGTAVALEWNYVAGDPINLRDPWGLQAASGPAVEQQAAPAGKSDVETDSTYELLGCSDDGKTCTYRKKETGETKTTESSTPVCDAVCASAKLSRARSNAAFDDELGRQAAARQARDEAERQRRQESRGVGAAISDAAGDARDRIAGWLGRGAGDKAEAFPRAVGLGQVGPAYQHVPAVEQKITEISGELIDSAAIGAGGKLGGVLLGSILPTTNRLRHIFGKPGHNLEPVVTTFGSQEAAFGALQEATQAAVATRGLSGVFETTVMVGGHSVVVRGKVIEGAAHIGTAFIPP